MKKFNNAIFYSSHKKKRITDFTSWAKFLLVKTREEENMTVKFFKLSTIFTV